MVNARQVRTSKDLLRLMNIVRADYVLRGLKPPSKTKITSWLAGFTNIDGLIRYCRKKGSRKKR